MEKKVTLHGYYLQESFSVNKDDLVFLGIGDDSGEYVNLNAVYYDENKNLKIDIIDSGLIDEISEEFNQICSQVNSNEFYIDSFKKAIFNFSYLSKATLNKSSFGKYKYSVNFKNKEIMPLSACSKSKFFTMLIVNHMNSKIQKYNKKVNKNTQNSKNLNNFSD